MIRRKKALVQGLVATLALAALSTNALAQKDPPSKDTPAIATGQERGVSAPEVHPGLYAAGGLLLLGGTMILLGRRRESRANS